MNIYNYRPDTGEFSAVGLADASPLEPGVFLIPANATTAAPPTASENQAAVFDGAAWALVPDWRGHEYWLADGSRHTIDALGAEPPEGALSAPPAPTPAQIIAALTAVIQAHLDDTAKTRGYDGILSLASYATSTNATFAAEALAGVAWRDAVWAKGYEIQSSVKAGTRTVPTAAELLAELPVMVWPA